MFETKHYFLHVFIVLVFLTLSFLCWLLVLLVLLVWFSSLLPLVVVSYFKFPCSGSCLCCCWFPGFYYVLSFGFVFCFCFLRFRAE